MPRVAIIIPVFNNWELTRDCLEQLAAHSPDSDVIDVIVVDNGSDDATPQACPALGRSLFGERFSLLRYASNRNFGPACNSGAAHAQAELLLFLNNDTRVSAGWLPPLVNELERPEVVGVGPLLLYPDGDVQHLGIAFWPGGGGLAHLYRNLSADHPLASRRRCFQALTAAALLVRKQDFVAAGGFDEAYINGFEDVDLGLRLTAKGRFMVCVPESRVIHLESRTPRRKAHDAANSARLAAKWPMARHGDLPELLAEDGYALRVLPDLELALELPVEAQRALLRMLSPFDPLRCYALLEKEPFWSHGYGLLGTFLKQQALHEEAAALYLRQFQLLLAPSPDEYARLHAALAAVGQSTALVDAGMARQRAALCASDYAARMHASVSALQSSGKPLHSALIAQYHTAAAEAARLRESLK